MSAAGDLVRAGGRALGVRRGAGDLVSGDAARARRWAQVALVGGGLGVVVRVPEPGRVGPGTIWVAELATGRTWAEHVVAAASPGARVRLRRAERDEAWELLVNVPGLTLDVTLTAGPGPFRLVGPGGGAPLVERWAALALRGRLRVGSEERALDGCAAMLEQVDAELPRVVRWSSAALLGAPAAYLSDLGDAPGECALWSDALPRPLGAAELRLPEPARPGRGPWTIASGDGRVALAFTPRAVNIEQRGAGPFASTHAWVFGTFAGRVEGAAIADAVGLCEARDWRM